MQLHPALLRMCSRRVLLTEGILYVFHQTAIAAHIGGLNVGGQEPLEAVDRLRVEELHEALA